MCINMQIVLAMGLLLIIALASEQSKQDTISVSTNSSWYDICIYRHIYIMCAIMASERRSETLSGCTNSSWCDTVYTHGLTCVIIVAHATHM